ncbi:MAG: mercury(II) reductase [Geobacteraceae bacterium]|nr:mercury(II) reductase [Geobacteraceae bacterium]
MEFTHDLIILGSGSTAFAAALRADSHGARVLLVEKSVLGGTCINWGCIPSKTMINSALFRHEAFLGDRIGLGMTAQDVDFKRLLQHRDQVVSRLRQDRYLDVLQKVQGLELVKGSGCFLDPQTIEVVDRKYRAERVLIATGGTPRIPAIQGLDEAGYLTSRSALLMKALPKSLLVIGGGVIAVELGQMFQRLGCRVTILEHGPRLLPAVDKDLAISLEQLLAAEGLNILTDVSFNSVENRNGKTIVNITHGGQLLEQSADQLLVAAGTAPAIEGIGLENAGVVVDRKGYIKTDERMRTSVSGIWAAGDVAGRIMSAPAGAREGIVAVDDMFNPGCGCVMDYLSIPMAIFSDPELGMVGHTEESACLAGIPVVTNKIPASAVPKAHVTFQTAGLIKMVADKSTRRLIGAHLLCHRGADLINEAALAIRLKATIDDLAAAIHVYPTMSEGLRLCAQGFSRDLSRLSCCAE